MKILFQGDSITDGNRYKDKALEWDKNHQIGHSYAYIVTGLLSLKHSDKNHIFINRGVAGNKTDDLLLRWQDDCLDINPDILIMLIGVNDVFFPLNEEEGFVSSRFEKNYRELLTKIRQKNPDIKIILLEPFVYLNHIIGEVQGVEKSNMEFVQRTVKTLASEFEAKFIPLQKDFDKLAINQSPEYWIWDGIHPTEAGHALIGQKLINELNHIL